MSAKPIIIDVRQPEEFATGHVEGALNVPLPELATSSQLAGINKDAPLVPYCNSGNRSGAAVSILKSQGFNNVVNGVNAANVRADYGQSA